MIKKNRKNLFADDNKGEATPPLSYVDNIEEDDETITPIGTVGNAKQIDFTIKENKRKGISLRFDKRIKPPEIKKKEKKKIISRERQRIIKKSLSSLVLYLQIFATKLGKLFSLLTDGKFFTASFVIVFGCFACFYLYEGLDKQIEVWQTILSIIGLILVFLLGNYFSDK